MIADIDGTKPNLLLYESVSLLKHVTPTATDYGFPSQPYDTEKSTEIFDVVLKRNCRFVFRKDTKAYNKGVVRATKISSAV